MNEIQSLGQVAFEAYRAEVQTAFNGDPIPEWDKLDNGAPARRGWEAAAQAVREHMRMMFNLEMAEVSRIAGVPGSRWKSLPTTPVVPDAECGPAGGVPVAGQGDAPTGVTVPVDVEPDADEVRDCDEPLCTRREADH